MVVWLKVPDAATFRELQEWGKKGDHFDVARAVIGKGIERIDNLELPTGEPFKLDRETSGLLTPECCEWLLPFAQELVGLTMRLSVLEEVDLKNSSSP